MSKMPLRITDVMMSRRLFGLASTKWRALTAALLKYFESILSFSVSFRITARLITVMSSPSVSAANRALSKGLSEKNQGPLSSQTR